MKNLLLATSLLLANLPAGELTIKTAPLETTLELEPTLLPSKAVPFKLKPKQWSKFEITDLVENGARVKKGEVVLSFKPDSYLRQIEESREAAKGRKIALAKLERELADLKITTARDLEGLQLELDRTKESLDYFNTSGKALKIETAEQSLHRAKLSLSYQEEELKQLLKMYKEDGITEETEEIILKRQKASVESAKFGLKKMTADAKWAIEKTIPRQAVDLQREFDQAKLAYETGKVNLPRALAEKELAVAKSQRSNAHADQDLIELETDGLLLTLKAPADGVIYHGEIKDGSWSLGGSAKFLFKTGTAPANTTLMSLVPDDSSLILHGEVGQGDFLSLSKGAKGKATVYGLTGSSFPIELTKLAVAPNATGKYSLTMSIALPKDTPLLTGMTAKATLVTYRNENAITVPKAAITHADGKSTVKLKMADGKDEIRTVKTGRTIDGKTEILSGLEVDQVIITP